jgi:hypothetical protein
MVPNLLFYHLLLVALVLIYQNMAEDHTCKGVGECHPYREFEGMQPSRKTSKQLLLQ